MARETSGGKEDYQDWKAPRSSEVNKINRIDVGGGREIPIPPEFKKGVAVAQELLAGEPVTMDAPEKTTGASAPEEPRVRRERGRPSSLKARLEKALYVLTILAVTAGFFKDKAFAQEAQGPEKGGKTTTEAKETLPKRVYRIEYDKNGSYVKFDAETGKKVEVKFIIYRMDGNENYLKTAYEYDHTGRLNHEYENFFDNGQIDTVGEYHYSYDDDGKIGKVLVARIFFKDGKTDYTEESLIEFGREREAKGSWDTILPDSLFLQSKFSDLVYERLVSRYVIRTKDASGGTIKSEEYKGGYKDGQHVEQKTMRDQNDRITEVINLSDKEKVRVSIYVYSDSGKLLRIETDTNFDGRSDEVQEFEEEK